MFEIEAEDSFNCKKVLYKWETDKHSYIDGFKDGAQFGYNKCKEELNHKGLALQSDMDKTIEQNIALKKELNKANEWHYVKDGDLPKEEGEVLIYWKSGDIKCASVVEPYKVTEDTHIIAWKEITLPKEG